MTEMQQQLLQLQQHINDFGSKIDDRNEQYSIIQENVQKILILLKGDKELNPENKGFIDQFNELKKMVEKHEKLRERIIWFTLGAGPTSVGIFELIKRIASKF